MMKGESMDRGVSTENMYGANGVINELEKQIHVEAS